MIEKSNGNDAVLTREQMYRVAKVDAAQVLRYSFTEACTNALATGHYGPWVDDPATLSSVA